MYISVKAMHTVKVLFRFLAALVQVHSVIERYRAAGSQMLQFLNLPDAASLFSVALKHCKSQENATDVDPGLVCVCVLAQAFC